MVAQTQLNQLRQINEGLAVEPEALDLICRRYRVERLALFGSALRPDFSRNQSDLDFVVDFSERLHLPWYGQLTGLIDDLSELFGRPVDVVERATLTNRFLVNEIERNALVIYGDLTNRTETKRRPMSESERQTNRKQGALDDIREGCDRLIKYCQGKTFEDFKTDEVLQLATERVFITIGEATNNLRKADPQAEQEINALGQIIAMRNRLVHQYWDTDLEIVWDVVQQHVPILRDQVVKLMDETDS